MQSLHLMAALRGFLPNTLCTVTCTLGLAYASNALFALWPRAFLYTGVLYVVCKNVVCALLPPGHALFDDKTTDHALDVVCLCFMAIISELTLIFVFLDNFRL